MDEKAQEGVYDRLVSKALGRPFSGKVLIQHSVTACLCISVQSTAPQSMLQHH